MAMVLTKSLISFKWLSAKLKNSSLKKTWKWLYSHPYKIYDFLRSFPSFISKTCSDSISLSFSWFALYLYYTCLPL